MIMINIVKIYSSFLMVAYRFIKHNQVEMEAIVLSKQYNLRLEFFKLVKRTNAMIHPRT